MVTNKLISFITNSQVRIFPHSEPESDLKCASMLSNDSLSFTLAYKSADGTCIPISIRANCNGAEVSLYKVCYVPVTSVQSTFPEVASENEATGLYPDLLMKRNPSPEILQTEDPRLPFYEENEENLLNASEIFNSVFITVNENFSPLIAGEYRLCVEILSLLTGEVLARHRVKIKVIGANLPENKMRYTNWVHYDCIADIHKVDLYSDEYFDVLREYLKNAVKHRMNTLLIPSFTPPLDTVSGGKRKNVQLVKIQKNPEGYTFDFSLLERFLSVAVSCGIKHFEHCHLFSQWGATGAPHIYAEENGKEVCIFDRSTDASSNEYAVFLQAYLTQFISLAKSLGISENLFFHISDEPTANNTEAYKKAVTLVSELLESFNSGDALNDIRFYENGLVKTPIVSISSADTFFRKCDSFWLYYTGGYYPGDVLEKCTNRLLTTKPYRTRILGLQLYRYKAKGFLHWGYNYYYDRMSKGLTDPKTNACGYKNIPGGAYLVYPSQDGVYSSLREKYMCEAFGDAMALQLLEKHIGYEQTVRLCESFFGKEINCFTIPENAVQMVAFREMINKEIEKNLRDIHIFIC